MAVEHLSLSPLEEVATSWISFAARYSLIIRKCESDTEGLRASGLDIREALQGLAAEARKEWADVLDKHGVSIDKWKATLKIRDISMAEKILLLPIDELEIGDGSMPDDGSDAETVIGTKGKASVERKSSDSDSTHSAFFLPLLSLFELPHFLQSREDVDQYRYLQKAALGNILHGTMTRAHELLQNDTSAYKKVLDLEVRYRALVKEKVSTLHQKFEKYMRLRAQAGRSAEQEKEIAASKHTPFAGRDTSSAWKAKTHEAASRHETSATILQSKGIPRVPPMPAPQRTPERWIPNEFAVADYKKELSKKNIVVDTPAKPSIPPRPQVTSAPPRPQTAMRSHASAQASIDAQRSRTPSSSTPSAMRPSQPAVDGKQVLNDSWKGLLESIPNPIPSPRSDNDVLMSSPSRRPHEVLVSSPTPSLKRDLFADEFDDNTSTHLFRPESVASLSRPGQNIGQAADRPLNQRVRFTPSVQGGSVSGDSRRSSRVSFESLPTRRNAVASSSSAPYRSRESENSSPSSRASSVTLVNSPGNSVVGEGSTRGREDGYPGGVNRTLRQPRTEAAAIRTSRRKQG